MQWHSCIPTPLFGLEHTTGAYRDFLTSLKEVKILPPFLFLLKHTLLPVSFPSCPPNLLPMSLPFTPGRGEAPEPSCLLSGGWAHLGLGTMAAELPGSGGLLSSHPVALPSPAKPSPCSSEWLWSSPTPPQWRSQQWQSGEFWEGRWRGEERPCLWAGSRRKVRFFTL